MKKALLIAAVVVAIPVGIKLFRSVRARLEARRPGLTLSSPDIQDGGVLSGQFALPGPKSNLTAPRLQWTHVPDGTASFVLLLHDPDVSLNRSWEDATLWLAFNIPGAAAELAPNVIATETPKDWMRDPEPNHHYVFELMALDTMLELPRYATRDEVLNAANGHILAKGILPGRNHQ